MATVVVKKGGVGELLDAVTATGRGDSYSPESRHCTFDLEITDTATVTVQVSWDNSTWRNLPGATSVTSTTQFSIAEWYPYIAGNPSSIGAGTVSLKMAVAPGDGAI